MERVFQLFNDYFARFLNRQASLWGQLGRASAAVLLFCAAFLSCKLVLHGIHPFHLLYVGVILALYFAHPASREFFIICIPMAIYGLFFDFFRHIPFEWLLPIRVRELYLWDLQLFGLQVGGEIMLFHEWILQQFYHPIADFFCGVVYFLHIPMVLILTLLFWRYRSASLAQRFTTAFLLLNLMAFATYYFYPAAAPWFVEKYGFIQPLFPVPGDAAGLKRFDDLLGLSVFADGYHISPVTFGAVPSMHAGYATLGWIYSLYFNRKLALVMGFYVLAMWFSAMYLQHHYLLDAVIGSLYAVVAWLVADKVFQTPIQNLHSKLFRFFGVKDP